MLKHVGQNLIILGLGLLSCLLVVLLVLELIPVSASSLEVKQRIDVSSSVIKVGQEKYDSSLRGILKNPTDTAVTVESLWVTVGNADGEELLIKLEGQSMQPRTTWEIDYRWESWLEYDRVLHVDAIVSGERLTVSNTETVVEAEGPVLLYVVLLLIAAGFLIHACKVRYYMYQEDRADAAEKNGDPR